MSRRVAGFLVPLLVLAAAGCSGLPQTTPVQRGLEVGAPGYNPPKIKYNPPTRDASPEQIVREFLTVNWAPNEQAVTAAKAFLTPEAADAWEPDSGVTVYRQSSQLKVVRHGSTVSVSGPLEATVDGDGRYRQAAVGETTRMSLTMRQVDGQWRIASLPEGFGVWLSWSNFTGGYQPLPVYFADPFERLLVPDLRWVPWGQGQLAALARAQLGGVPAYVQGAAVSGIAPGTELAVDSVPVVDGVAQVELTRAPTTAEQRRMAWAQMFATLTQVPGVRAVTLSVDGVPLTFPGLPQQAASLESLGFAAPAPAPLAVVLRRGTGLQAADFTGWLAGGQEQRPVEASLPTVPREWGHLAVSEDLTQVAGVDAAGDRIHRWTPSGSGSPSLPGLLLTEPAFDRRGRLWIGGIDRRTGRSQIWWLPTQAAATAVPRPLGQSWVGRTERVTAVKPSPGGRRLAVVVRTADGASSVFVSGISVGQGREPVELREPYRVAAGLRDVKDLAWVDDSTLAVIAGMGDEPVSPVLLPIGAQPRLLPPVKDAVQVMTSGGPKGVLVVSASGIVWRRSGGGWHQQDQVDELVIPGS